MNAWTTAGDALTDSDSATGCSWYK